MNQNIYFPIWSNISFFEQRSAKVDLITKIKQSVLMYNQLHFDSGGYQFSCNDWGKIDLRIPPESIEQNDFKVPEKPMTGFSLNISKEGTNKWHNIIPPSKGSKAYFVSFQSLLKEINLSDDEIIMFHWQDLTPDGKKILDQRIKQTESYKRYIEGNSFFKSGVFSNFHKSILMSMNLKTPMVLDNLHDSLLTNISKEILKVKDIRLEVLSQTQELLKFYIPDFSSMEIEDILKLRKDKLFTKFREKLLEINNKVVSENPTKINLSDIKTLLVSDLIKEMEEMAPSKDKLIFTGLMGLGGVVGTGITAFKEWEELCDFKNSWLAYIFQKKE